MNETGPRIIDAQCVIAGGGPAGMMLGFLLGRAGVRTIVLEKHKDFLRDFRGDTVHPSTLMIMQELGLIDRFLKLPHQKLAELDVDVGGSKLTIADFNRIKAPCKFLAMMPQWDFLNFLAREGRQYANLSVMMEAEVSDLLYDSARIAGVAAKTPDGTVHIKAPLTVGADGRGSIVRAKAELEVQNIGAPIDVLWFRVPRGDASSHHVFGSINAGKMLVTLDRGEYWQCAFIIPKGGLDALKARGFEAFRADIVAAAPDLKNEVTALAGWDDVKLLSVAIDRLKHWAVPGLLCIGDASHAMSPVGGVGINLAVQDAVAAANILAAKLRAGSLVDSDLEAVQARRAWPARVIQSIQVAIQNNVLTPVISGKAMTKPPFMMRVVARFGVLRGLLARVVGMGVRPEHVRNGPA